MKRELTLAMILARTVEEGECLIWTAGTFGGRPRWTFNGKDQSPRRTVYEAVHGPVPARHQVGVNCKNELCVHPDHGVARSRSEAMKNVRFMANHDANVAMALRKKSALSQAAVAEIRSAHKTGAQIAEQYGISVSYANMIKRGAYRRDYSSPFNGLGA